MEIVDFGSSQYLVNRLTAEYKLIFTSGTSSPLAGGPFELIFNDDGQGVIMGAGDDLNRSLIMVNAVLAWKVYEAPRNQPGLLERFKWDRERVVWFGDIALNVHAKVPSGV